MINVNSVVSYRNDIDTTDLDGDKVMMDLENGKYFSLNSVGSRIWELIESPVKVSDVVSSLMEEYEIDKQTCEKSVIDFLEGLNDAKLISVA